MQSHLHTWVQMGPYRSGTPSFSSAYNRIPSSNNVLRTRVAIFKTLSCPLSHLTLITPLRKAWLVLLSPLWWGGNWLKAKWLMPISEPVSGRVLTWIQVSCLGILDSLYHLFRFWLKFHLLQGAFSTHRILSHLWRVLNIIFYATHLTITTNALSGHLSWSMCLVPLHYLQASPETGTM